MAPIWQNRKKIQFRHVLRSMYLLSLSAVDGCEIIFECNIVARRKREMNRTTANGRPAPMNGDDSDGRERIKAF